MKKYQELDPVPITAEELAMQVPRVHFCKGCGKRIQVNLLEDQPWILLACLCGHLDVYAKEEQDGLLGGVGRSS